MIWGNKYNIMYQAKNYENLIGMEGFSDDLLKNHFKLYEGYVANVNKVSEILKETDKASPQYAELKRRFGWEFNGMRLHELYFSNLIKDASEIDKSSSVYKKIENDFGSFESWKEDFIASGAMRGIGWVVLCYDKESDKLFNIWINEHDLGYLAGATPLLVMDVFEHAFVLDYKMDRKSYINAFINGIYWEEVERRLNN